jgi:hypothetical protein
LKVSDTARNTIFDLVDGYIATPASVSGTGIPQEVVADLGTVLKDSRISYRDGVMIQLAYGLAGPGLNLTKRQAGARSVAQQLGAFFAQRHIRSVKDAYQNIAKNTDVLVRGNMAEFDRLLLWANDASIEDREIVLRIACASVAATARPVHPMPQLNRSALTFVRVVGLFHNLLAMPSGGAFEQFAVAALLDTLVTVHGDGRARIVTKNLNASDRSSFAAGDVQVVVGNRVVDAFEVTAKDWRTKVADASKTIRDNDLSRLHIIAFRPEGNRDAVAFALQELVEDVSVLDARQVVEVLAAVLTRPQRADALARLYEYLDRYQPDTNQVNLFVTRLEAAKLVERPDD